MRLISAQEDTVYVKGVIGVPGGLKATAQRGSVEVSWSEPSAEYVKVVAYQVFKWTGEEAPTEPTFPNESGTSLVDDRVEAEESYSYKVRAVGVAKPEKKNDPTTRRRSGSRGRGPGRPSARARQARPHRATSISCSTTPTMTSAPSVRG